MTPREVLLAAADLLSMVGWARGEFNRDKPMDVLKAIKLAAANVNDSADVVAGAMNLLRRHIGSAVSVWSWEDGRTRDEVVRALREAAR